MKLNLNLNKGTRTQEKSVENIDGIDYAVTTITTIEKRYVFLDKYQASVDAQIEKLQGEKVQVAEMASAVALEAQPVKVIK